MDNNNRTPHTEAEEFNAFNATSSPAAEAKKRPPQRPAQSAPKKNGGWNKKLILGIAIGVLVLLLVVGIVVVALSRDRHIMREDNAYLVYSDAEDRYHVLANGHEIEKEFEGEVTLTVSADNSFAYVVDNGEDGYYVYILKGKKLEPITQSAVDDVLEYAALEPGLIYEDGNKIRMWNEDVGEHTVTSNSAADDFMISGDASTVIYNEPNKKDTSKIELKLFRPDDEADEVLGSKSIRFTPIAISNYGDYVYASFTADDVKKLCVFKTNDLEELGGDPIAESEGFAGYIDMNVKGDELLFYTTKVTENGPQATTKLFRFDKDEKVAVDLLNGIMMPKKIDPDVVYFDDFSDVYMTAYKLSDPTARAIHYVDKKYVRSKVVDYKIAAGVTDTCTIDPSGRYLYYVNEDTELYQIDLKDEKYDPIRMTEDVIEFYITEKGNIYFLESDGTLRFREANKKKNNRIAEDVLDISFYRYANTLYFTKDEAVNIFMTKEGSAEENVKMDSAQVTALPRFTNANGKQTYAAYYDVDDGGKIFFTSNGKKFKMVTSNCEEIFGISVSEFVD